MVRKTMYAASLVSLAAVSLAVGALGLLVVPTWTRLQRRLYDSLSQHDFSLSQQKNSSRKP